MINPKISALSFMTALAILTAACTPSAAPITPTPTVIETITQPATLTPVPTESITPTPADPQPEGQETQPSGGEVEDDLSRSDAQGNIEVVVTPLNLNQPGETLDFDVSLNTHSVDLSMDLSKLAVLTNDLGVTVQPAKWDAPMGGHHVAGTLSFPTTAGSGSLLDGATSLTLTLRNVEVPERVFEWQITAP